MGRMYWVRVAMMVFTFAVVVVTMRKLQTNKPTASPIAQAILGTGDGRLAEKIVICPTRVTWLETSRGLRIEQDGMKWVRVGAGGEKTELDPIAVEKWFGRNCSLSATKSQASEMPGGSQTALKLGYVSGDIKQIEQARSGEYLWQGAAFISAALDEALRALPDLPRREPAH